MIRRTLVVTVFMLVLLACAASPALAFAPLWTQTVDTWSGLATGTRGPIVAWKVTGVGTASIEAAQYPREGGAALGQRTIVPAVAGLEDWYVAGDGASSVTVVWKAAGVISAKRVDLSTGVRRVRPRHGLLGRPGRRAARRRRDGGPRRASPPTAPAASTCGPPSRPRHWSPEWATRC